MVVNTGVRAGSIKKLYTPLDEAGAVAWGDSSTLVQSGAVDGALISEWQAGNGITATQQLSSRRPVALRNERGVMYAKSDGIDDFMHINLPAFFNNGVWGIFGGTFRKSSPFPCVLNIGGSSDQDTAMMITTEIFTRHFGGAVESSRRWPLNTTNFAAAYTPPQPNNLYSKVQIFDENGDDKAILTNNNTSFLNYSSPGGELFRIWQRDDTVVGFELYYWGVFRAPFDRAAYRRVLAYGLSLTNGLV